MIAELIREIKTVPEYLIALKSAVAVLTMGLPIYAGLRYFLYRRRLEISIWVTLNFIGSFILFAGLAFLLASPLASHIPQALIAAYLFLTCVAASMGAVAFIDVFLVQHYLIRVKHIYISPPLRLVIKLGVFCLALLPILRYVLRFNPLALVAIPTIATAGVALALQDTLKAFIAGIDLGHVIRLGQWIAFQDKEGRVLDVNSARTTLETVDGQKIYIPNRLLQTGVFLNYNTLLSPTNNQSLKIRAPYDLPPERVKETLLRAIQGASGVVDSPPPQAYITEYGDSGIVYGLFYVIEDYKVRQKILDQVATRVWHALDREGIPIAYPTRTVLMDGVSVPAKKTRTKKSL